MQYVTDLHLHSKYSRAVSPRMDLQFMALNARQKGLDVLTAADFTHPVWIKEIREQLMEAEEGLFVLKSEIRSSKSETNTNVPNPKDLKQVRFMLSTEISSIYKQRDKLRRIHNLVFVPSFETAEKFTKALVARGCNLNADGRPIVGISAESLYDLDLILWKKRLVRWLRRFMALKQDFPAILI